VGVGVRGYRPFASTFAAFFTRAYDFIRMAAISRASICLAGSHAGVEIGADGPSQMALEDLAMMRAVHGSAVLYPSDPTSAAAAATGGRLVIAEDHHPEGGIGSAVVDALTSAGRAELSIAHLAVREMPGSGTTEELLAESGIAAGAIVTAARRLLA